MKALRLGLLVADSEGALVLSVAPPRDLDADAAADKVAGTCKLVYFAIASPCMVALNNCVQEKHDRLSRDNHGQKFSHSINV